MMTFILSFTLYTLTSSNRLLLQQNIGTYGQECMPPSSDFLCTTPYQTITDQGSQTLECGIDYGCCFCESIICGSEAQQSYCDTFKSGGEYSTFGVQDIQIYGQPGTSGAVLDCGAPNACTGTSITGSWIDIIQCVGTFACNKAVIDVSNSRGLSCGQESCIDATFILNSNLGGEINCNAEKSCVNAVIEIGGIQNIKCNGDFACQNAKITLTNPSEAFHLNCNGPNACENLELTLVIPPPEFPCHSAKIVEWKGITCGSGGGCEGMKFTIINDGCNILRLEELSCDPGRACTGAVFNLNAGNSIFGGVELQNCMCGPSCRDATGIDLCYNNLKTMECMDAYSCQSQTRQITNPSNDFLLLCNNIESCANFNLEIIVSGGSGNLVQRFAGFDCGAERSCKQATISIVNTQRTSNGEIVPILVSDVVCSVKESCDGATFVTGDNVEINNIVCAPGACQDCFVKRNVNDVFGIPCGPDTTTAIAPIITTTTTAVPPPLLPVIDPVVIVNAAESTTTIAPIITTTTTAVPPPLLPAVVPPVIVNAAESTTTTTTTVAPDVVGAVTSSSTTTAAAAPPPPIDTSTTTTTTKTATIPTIPFVPFVIPNVPRNTQQVNKPNGGTGIPPIPDVPSLPIPNKPIPDPTNTVIV